MYHQKGPNHHLSFAQTALQIVYLHQRALGLTDNERSNVKTLQNCDSHNKHSQNEITQKGSAYIYEKILVNSIKNIIFLNLSTKMRSKIQSPAIRHAYLPF